MTISQLPELFVQRERTLLGPRFDAMFSYPGQGAVRGASVNALWLVSVRVRPQGACR